MLHLAIDAAIDYIERELRKCVVTSTNPRRDSLSEVISRFSTHPIYSQAAEVIEARDALVADPKDVLFHQAVGNTAPLAVELRRQIASNSENDCAQKRPSILRRVQKLFTGSAVRPSNSTKSSSWYFISTPRRFAAETFSQLKEHGELKTLGVDKAFAEKKISVSSCLIPDALRTFKELNMRQRRFDGLVSQGLMAEEKIKTLGEAYDAIRFGFVDYNVPVIVIEGSPRLEPVMRALQEYLDAAFIAITGIHYLLSVNMVYTSDKLSAEALMALYTGYSPTTAAQSSDQTVSAGSFDLNDPSITKPIEALASQVRISSPGTYQFLRNDSTDALAEEIGALHRRYPTSPELHYAYASALQLNLTGETANRVLAECVSAHPAFWIADLTMKRNGLFAGNPLTCPQFESVVGARVHDSINDILMTALLLTTRRGMIPRATLFQRDDGFEVPALQSCRMDFMTIISPVRDPQVIAINARIWDNPSDPLQTEVLACPWRRCRTMN